MKNYLIVTTCCMLLAAPVRSQVAPADSILLDNLGKGTLFLRNQQEIRNIRLYAIRELYMTYRKDGNLHDVLKDEIVTAWFPEASPGPVELVFVDKKPVLRKLNRSRYGRPMQ